MEALTATQAWVTILFDLETAPEIEIKGNKTREILGNSMMFDMKYPFIHHPKRYFNEKFFASEAYAICHGDNRVENLAKYNKNIKQFSDDEYIFNGAYGPPFNDQLMYVVNQLRLDPNTRQAVLTIWKQNPVESKDIRCTLSLQFMIRDGLLHTFVNMRSSDAIWGLTYDFPVFTFMTLRVLTLLNINYKDTFGDLIDLGFLHWSAASSHIYERHYDLVKKVLDYSENNDMIREPPLPKEFICDWKAVTDYLHSLMGDQNENSDN